MATMLQGTLRGRFNVLSRELWFGGVQCPQLTWCVFRSLFGRHRTGALSQNETQLSRRLAGSHLDIKKHFRKSGSQLARYRNLPVLHVNATFNNTVITISDNKGKTMGWVSAGTEGYQNARKGSSTAGRQAGVAAAYKAISFGVERARIKVRGIGMGRQGAVNGIESGGVTIVSVTDVTPVPHNGCRPRKTRRM